ncbi:MAG: M20/M25/M40 family metallo-hydrolase [Chitinophagales bacterium]|nr:M20/M25/M40 family metallo-hydrolase [Chitinophagales bacterium]
MRTIYTFILLLFINHTLTLAQDRLSDLIDEMQVDSLTKAVKQLSGELPVTIYGKTDTIFSRSYMQQGNEKAFQFIKQQMQSYHYKIDSLVFSSTGKNLLVFKKGSQFPQQEIIIGAHYDSRPYSGVAPGADDNASGVAAIMEVARVLKDEELPYTIVFAFWDEEEPGLLGSKAYVQSIGSRNETLLAYINLDMIAWDGDNDGEVEISTRQVGKSISLSDLIIEQNANYQIGLKTTLINPGPSSSDYASFWTAGYTASGINEVYYGEDNNPYWHTVGDTIGNMNLEYFLKCSKLTLASVYRLAQEGINKPTAIIDSKWHEVPLLYPNPVKEVLFISNLSHKVESVKIYDLKGSGVYKNEQVFDSKIVLPFQMRTGIYIIEINTRDKSYRQLIFKQ